jgi:hypothetical protein
MGGIGVNRMECPFIMRGTFPSLCTTSVNKDIRLVRFAILSVSNICIAKNTTYFSDAFTSIN